MTRALVLLVALAGASLAGCGDDAAPIAPTCDDGILNGTETGVDCGGGTCGVCDDGEGCSQGADCATGVCSQAGVCVAISCTDGRLNGDETDVDCGGSCEPCGVGDRCELAADCASELCGETGLCVAGACGDGVVTGDEDCDDGGESADCNADCTAATCGDLVVNDAAGEQCDSGGVDTVNCDADCSLRSCGDSVANPEAGETCDDGGVNTAACDLDCSAPGCGDGLFNAAAGELCDDAGDSYVCNADCSLAECGDLYVNAAHLEDCDEGGVDTAACNMDCTAAICGDGYSNAEAGEECDDAGESADCNADCTIAICSDGITNETAGEDCDDAGESATCNADCTAATCGDGLINETAGETCDDAGESATCDADCSAPTCGDGVPNTTAGETCDDGNTDDDDGCSALCRFERLVAPDPFGGSLYQLDRDTFTELAALPLTVPDSLATIAGINALARHPSSNEVFLIAKLFGEDTRSLGVVDLGTGEVTLIGDTGEKLAGLAFNDAGTLYAISGDGSSTPETLFTVDLATGTLTTVAALGNGDDGEVIAMRPGDDRVFHWSGLGSGSEFFDVFDPSTGVTTVLASGDLVSDEVFGATWSPDDDAFLVFDINRRVTLHNVDGTITDTGLVLPRNLRTPAWGELGPFPIARTLEPAAMSEGPQNPEPARPHKTAQRGGCSVAGGSGAAGLLFGLALGALLLRRRRS